MYRASEPCRAGDVPLTFDGQLQSLPAFKFIAPNTCEEMHTLAKTGTCPFYFGPVSAAGAIGTGDAWLSHRFPCS